MCCSIFAMPVVPHIKNRILLFRGYHCRLPFSTKVERMSMRGSMNGKSSSTVAQRLISDARADGNLVSISESVSVTSTMTLQQQHMKSLDHKYVTYTHCTIIKLCS